MKRKSTKVYVMAQGVTLMSSELRAKGENTLVDSHVPQDKRLREMCVDILLMAAHEVIEEPWKRAKILAVLGASPYWTGIKQDPGAESNWGLASEEGTGSVPDNSPF